VIDSRAFAILHAAVHDALNGIERRYAAYTIELSFPTPPSMRPWHRRRMMLSANCAESTRTIDREFAAAVAVSQMVQPRTQG
jgi:hypothetical protein